MSFTSGNLARFGLNATSKLNVGRRVRKEKQKLWNDTLHHYRIHAHLHQRPRLSQYLDTKTDAIQSDDMELNDEPFISFENGVMEIAQDLRHLSTPLLININQQLYQDQKDARQEHFLMAMDEEYTIETDPSNDNTPAYKTEGMTTRSKSKRKLKGDYSHKFDNVEFDDMRYQYQVHDEVLQEIYGHRGKLDFFKDKKFIELQKADNHLQLAKSLLLTKPDERKKDDLLYLTKWEPHLSLKVTCDDLRINEAGVIQARHWSIDRQESYWTHVVPFAIRGKIMDYYHHNLQGHHFSWKYMFDQLDARYWWGTSKRDVRKFCENCVLCQFVKGSKRHRAPLQVRHLPKPREHLFADFLQGIYGQYHILFLIDYATGYAMLIPTNGTDAVTVVNSILKQWVPIFGWFTIFEADWGSGFKNKIMRALTKASGIELELAEPRNHRSIGKVERVIGFVQSILTRYNLLLGEQLTDNQDEFDHSWAIIESLLPFIQMALNQRRHRFTTYSPNMLMFGTNVKDISDIDRIKSNLESIKKDGDLDKEDYQYLTALVAKIAKVNEAFKSDWLDYAWISRMSYSEKYNINIKKTRRYLNKFKIGSDILYFIGDKQTARGKWKHKWTGPWKIDKKLNDSTLIISDPINSNQKRVSFDSIKLFKNMDVVKYQEAMNNDQSYSTFQRKLLNTLSNYTADVREQSFDLDYTRHRS